MDSLHLLSLAERVEAAGGPCRAIDATIYHDLLGFCRHANKERTGAQSYTGFDCMDCGADSWGNKSRKGGYPVGQGLHDSAPRYTASIDAAMTLADRGYHLAFDVHFMPEDDVIRYRGYSFQPDWSKWNPHDMEWLNRDGSDNPLCATPALAICAAALRALSQSHSQTERGEA